jgi:hypothetical protein
MTGDRFRRIPACRNPRMALVFNGNFFGVNPVESWVNPAPDRFRTGREGCPDGRAGGAARWRRSGARGCARVFLLDPRVSARIGGALAAPAPPALLSRFLARKKADPAVGRLHPGPVRGWA